jgi:Tol biopolymer transport system component
MAGAALLFAAGWLLRPAGRIPDEPVRKLDLSIDRLVVSQGRVPVISPDGSQVAYVAGGQLRVRRLDSLDATTLVAGDDVVYPSWSPDSRELAYVRQGRAWRISSEGGSPAELGPVPSDLVGSGGSTWTADGQVVFAGSDTVGLWALPAAGGAGRDLLPLERTAEADFHEISSLPDGRGLMFTAHPRGRMPDTIAVLSGGSRRVLLELKGESLRSPVYVPTGHIVYTRETTNPGLWAVPFSIDRLETTGAPFLVLSGASAPSVARDGTLCFLRADDTPVELVRVSRAGVIEPVADLPGTNTSMLWAGPTGTGFQQWGGVSLSPDGSRVALSIGFSPGHVLVYDLARGSLSSIATGTFPSRPVWSNDGERLFYGSSRDSRAWNLWSRRADGGGEEERYSASEEVEMPSALSPDGKTLVFSRGSGPSGGFFRMPAVAAANPVPLFGGQVWGLAASFSPDGRFLAHESPESGHPEIYVRPFPDGGQRLQVSTGGGAMPVWARNGEIFYVSGSAIVAVPVTVSGGSVTAAKPAVLFQTGQQNWLAPTFDVTPDGKTLFMLRARGREQVSLILNWFDELRRGGAAGDARERR